MIHNIPPTQDNLLSEDDNLLSEDEFRNITDRKNNLRIKLTRAMNVLLSKSKTLVHPSVNVLLRLATSDACHQVERILDYSVFLDHGISRSGEKLRWLKFRVTTYTPSLNASRRITQFGTEFVLTEKEDIPVVYVPLCHIIYPNFYPETPDNHWARRVIKELFMELNTGRKIEPFIDPDKYDSAYMHSIRIESEFHEQHSNNMSITLTGTAHRYTM